MLTLEGKHSIVVMLLRQVEEKILSCNRVTADMFLQQNKAFECCDTAVDSLRVLEDFP
jgi:hypothetical protein